MCAYTSLVRTFDPTSISTLVVGMRTLQPRLPRVAFWLDGMLTALCATLLVGAFYEHVGWSTLGQRLSSGMVRLTDTLTWLNVALTLVRVVSCRGTLVWVYVLPDIREARPQPRRRFVHSSKIHIFPTGQIDGGRPGKSRHGRLGGAVSCGTSQCCNRVLEGSLPTLFYARRADQML